MPMGFAIPATGERRPVPWLTALVRFWLRLHSSIQDSISHSSCASISNLSLDRIIGPFLIPSDRETRSLYARRDVANPPPIILVSSLG